MEFEENINIIDLMTEKNKYNSHKTIYIYVSFNYCFRIFVHNFLTKHYTIYNIFYLFRMILAKFGTLNLEHPVYTQRVSSWGGW